MIYFLIIYPLILLYFLFENTNFLKSSLHSYVPGRGGNTGEGMKQTPFHYSFASGPGFIWFQNCWGISNSPLQYQIYLLSYL